MGLIDLKYLYIGGPSRSGTTALTSYLNQHPEIMVCRERFKWLHREDVTPEVFTFERILDFDDGYEKRDTTRRKQVHEDLVNRKDSERLRWMGDKYPGYVRRLDGLSENNPGASFMLTYRPVEEVAESFEARSRNPGDAWLGGREGFRLGVEAWNKAMQHTRDFIESGVNPNVLVVGYHDFFYRNEEYMPLVSRFLDLAFDESVLRAWREESQSFEGERREKEPVNNEQQALIDEYADREAETYVLRRIKEQYEEFDLYPPEAARRLIDERRRFAVRIAEERKAAKAEKRKLEKRTERVGVLAEKNENLTRQARNLEQQMQAVRSSKSWRLLTTLSTGRRQVLDNGRRLAGRLTGSDLGSKPGFDTQHKSQEHKPEDRPPGKPGERDTVLCEGVVLPPGRLRPNGKRRTNDDEFYLYSTRREVDWMVENLGLSSESSLLDLGCGPGRIPIGILDRIGEIRKYRGVDVQERYVEWARRHVAAGHPSFQFIRLDAKNAYYNPEGSEIQEGFTLPFADGEFDVACLFSVFTHMLTEDVEKYLGELHRVLGPEGKVLLTANLEDDVPDVTDNPEGYRGRWSYRRPLASVRYNREFFEGLLDENGFRLERYDPNLRKPQRTLIVSKKPA